MEREEQPKAREAFLAYRQLVREGRGTEEDEQIMRGYRELAKGQKLIALSETMRAGGIELLEVPDRWQRSETRTVAVPRLAIARADAQFCWTFGIARGGALELRGKREVHNRNRRDRIVFPPGTFDNELPHDGSWAMRIRAMAPNIPAGLRPARKLGGFHLLWEADWEIDHSVPPGDPALLKHIGGDLYAVLATWDLTPLEQAVLAGRMAE